MRVILSGGQSAGHLAPLVSVWREVQAMEKNSEALCICSTKSDDAEFLKKEDVAFAQIPVPRASLTFPFTFLRAYRKARSQLKKFKPDVIFSKGGAVSVPTCLAAYAMEIPIVLHESDAVSGRANRFVSKFAQITCRGFPTPLSPTPDSLHPFTGNPTRPGIANGSKAEGYKITGFTGKRPVLLVFGGSQGAKALNEALHSMLTHITEHYDVIHLTGKGKGEHMVEEHHWATPFAYEELPHLYAITDVAMSRAGAGSISELAMNGIATILVPLEGLAQNHQVENAKVIASLGAGIHLPQESLGTKLVPLLQDLAEDHTKRTLLGEGLRKIAAPNAARLLAEILFKVNSRK
jgi:UDP-N-acetylglucosamine--N-acetylmuramyl-(pentapeptide) pyrophosphoryl-undecaprenol N-acetylglucosamine transferase